MNRHESIPCPHRNSLSGKRDYPHVTNQQVAGGEDLFKYGGIYRIFNQYYYIHLYKLLSSTDNLCTWIILFNAFFQANIVFNI